MPPMAKRAVAGVPARNMRAGSVRPAASRQTSTQTSKINATTLSPTNSVASRARSPVAGSKRKERDFDLDGGEETNINVVVRCRGRNDREVQENSGVVVSTEGARGKTVDLSMGPNALSNKTYHFDKVFSPAADQFMVYDDVVAPILDEMIAGYNCTVFAYGQTGTGKTYTMSGDMTDTLGLLSDAAGIIPRTLYSLFGKLEAEGTENTVKVSFIELYNEELRDLLASDDATKLKLYEADQKKGHSATIVQGMEEAYIRSAQEGVRLLQQGSDKRQVAATKCNDLSSRGHTVFTITVYTKRASETEEDWVVSGKLNLVDLAGSENIQRSGAENKRAAEAGLINKSLLTLGRVINALVDKGPHIPYRESKLTRLLQDSLGGRTKTCIIATISPARSNLEETISTLDYAFRAKNIRNKPQVNLPVTKKTLLREYTSEIQQLKSELIATRQRNGVYLSNDHYEQITVESESRRILSEEQRAKIETMETNLRNKVQDLFNLTNNLTNLKKDHATTQQRLEDTNDVLHQTGIVLAETKQSLEDEATLRKAHQSTEEQLGRQGAKLISTLNRTVEDVSGLHAKIRRKSDLQTINRNHWQSSQTEINNISKLVEGRVDDFKNTHAQLVTDFSNRVQVFLDSELKAVDEREASLLAARYQFETNQSAMVQHSAQAKTDMQFVVAEISGLRANVESEVGAGLHNLATAAGRISTGITEKLSLFHDQLDKTYCSLGQDLNGIFDDLNERLCSQEVEADLLRQQLLVATQAAQAANANLTTKLEESLQKERQQSASERESLISQITNLINANGTIQDQRMVDQIDIICSEAQAAELEFQSAEQKYSTSMSTWLENGVALKESVINSKDIVTRKLQADWKKVEEHNGSMKTLSRSLQSETSQLVETQIKNMSAQMQALDDLAARAKSANEDQHALGDTLLEKMAQGVAEIHEAVISTSSASRDALQTITKDLTAHGESSGELASSLSGSIQQPMTELRNGITSTALTEYTSTGFTPQKTIYEYPKTLASTAPHAEILNKQTPSEEEPLVLPIPDLIDVETPVSPTRGNIYTDADNAAEPVSRPSTSDTTTMSLREVPINVVSSDRDRERDVDSNKVRPFSKSLNLGLAFTGHNLGISLMGPPAKRGISDTKSSTSTKTSRIHMRNAADGRENDVLPIASRLNASIGPNGRKLRSSVRQE